MKRYTLEDFERECQGHGVKSIAFYEGAGPRVEVYTDQSSIATGFGRDLREALNNALIRAEEINAFTRKDMAA